MKCPHCSFDNRDDAAFCENCGEVFVAASAKVSVPPVVEVPPVVRVPDVAPAPSKPAPRASVADLVDPVRLRAAGRLKLRSAGGHSGR